MLALEGVSKRFGGSQALAPTHLNVPGGQTTALIGPSGCGKSTLLRIVAGLVSPDSGTLRFRDRVIEERSLPWLRQRLGYVIQEGGLFPHLNARDNVALMPRYLGWDRRRLEARIDELSTLVRLPHTLLGRYPSELSGGQRQRVSLMRALVLDPELVLLDEPLGALDPMIRFELQDELRELLGTVHKTVLLVTHDIGEAAFLGDQVVLMREGSIVQQGTLEDLVRRPASAFVSDFIRAQQRSSQLLHELTG